MALATALRLGAVPVEPGRVAMRVWAPNVVYPLGNPSPPVERLADVILAARPGLLIVTALD